MIDNLPHPDWQSPCGDYVLYHGDCLDILPKLPDGCVDAVVTDPPYGIGFAYESYDDTKDNWRRLINGMLPHARRIARFVVMPSCQIKELPWWYANHAPDWLIAWHKGSPGHCAKVGFNAWEPHVSWGRPKRPMHDHFKTRCGFDANGHPCPKPIEWAEWLVPRAAGEGGIVFDPFTGSGTTGVACVKTGRKFIGIELEKTYFDIAVERIEKALNDAPLLQEASK